MPAHRKYDPRKIEAAVRDARTLGAPEAGRRHGLPGDVVFQTARRRGIPIYRTYRGRRKKTDYTPALHILHTIFQGVPLTQTEIAAGCGVSKERIRQIEETALRKIRNDPQLIAKLRDLP